MGSNKALPSRKTGAQFEGSFGGKRETKEAKLRGSDEVVLWK